MRPHHSYPCIPTLAPCSFQDPSYPPTMACWLRSVHGKKGRGQSFFCSGSSALE
ncbi:hypothetical protein LDENG_00059210 [Lucifuga dentata]|nr:hypothetical protein LDENG_00059210 [Lucifuga dentata]